MLNLLHPSRQPPRRLPLLIAALVVLAVLGIGVLVVAGRTRQLH